MVLRPKIFWRYSREKFLELNRGNRIWWGDEVPALSSEVVDEDEWEKRLNALLAA